MKKLDVHSPVFVVSPAHTPDLKPAARLIVLLPESEVDAVILAEKIRGVANVLESRVQLLGLSKDAAHEPGVRRRLITLAAMIEGSTIFVESKVEIGSSWVHAVKPHWHPGDVIVCLAEQHSSFAGKPLHHILESRLNATVYVLSGIPISREHSRPGWLSNVIAWIGSGAILLGFFWLQSWLIQAPQGWGMTFFLYVSLFLEAGAIWIWNNLLG